MGQQIQQERVFTGGRVLDQLDQFSSLLGRQRQRGDTEGGALGNVFAIGLQHGVHLVLRGKKIERGSVVRILQKRITAVGQKTRRTRGKVISVQPVIFAHHSGESHEIDVKSRNFTLFTV